MASTKAEGNTRIKIRPILREEDGITASNTVRTNNKQKMLSISNIGDGKGELILTIQKEKYTDDFKRGKATDIGYIYTKICISIKEVFLTGIYLSNRWL